MIRRILVLSAILACALADPVGAQQVGNLIVTVTQRMTGGPMEGAQVALQGGGTRTGRVTNAEGRALFVGVPVGSYLVTVTYLGYSDVRRHDVQVTAGGSTALEISMETAVLSLEGITVSATVDPTSGVKLPFTVAKVDEPTLQVPSVNSALAAIQGKVAGVNIVRASGQPGAGVNILLRSPTAFEESNSPLFVIDGVVMSRELGRTTADIEALDIVGVEIIKGAAAATLYGSRASSGVISITTRRGTIAEQGQTRVTSRTEFGQDYLAGRHPLTTSHHYLLNAAGNRLVNEFGRDTTWAGRTSRTVTANGGNARMMDQAYPGQIFDNLAALYQPDRYLN